MNEEIMFRGRRVPDGEWIISDSILRGNGTICLKEGTRWRAIYKETFGQYSGFNDKYDSPIFKDDVVKAVLKDCENCYVIGHVIFENGTFKIKVMCDSNNEKGYKAYCGEEIKAFPIENNFINRGYQLKIVGNLHEDMSLYRI